MSARRRTARAAIAGAAALAALLAALGPGGAASVHDEILEHRTKIDAIHRELQQKRAVLSTERSRAAQLHDELTAANRNVALTTSELVTLDARVRSNRRKLAWNQRQLDAAQATLALHDNELRKRLVDAYEHGEIGYVNVLFSATSFTDFVERWQDIKLLVAANERAVEVRRAAEERVAAVQRSLSAQSASLAAATARAQSERARLVALVTEKHQIAAAADAAAGHAATEVADLEEVSAQEQAAITALIVERQREEAARREQERRASLLSGAAAPPGYDSAPHEMTWPVTGPITSPFGFRPNPTGGTIEHHDGIDIAAAMGTTVAAAAGGKVIIVEMGWGGGYGNHIVIDDGGGVATLYAHLSQVFVSEGQDVRDGEAIGAVGSTGHSTGPHLHFEVRVNGTPVDPLGWLH